MPGSKVHGGTMDRDEAEAYVAKIWMAERARYGRGRARPPQLKSGGRGARGDYYGHEISLGGWARNQWVACHEVAHVLVGPKGGWHGPRFVAALMGIASRHLGYDVNELMAVADEVGIKYHVRSIGAVPVINQTERLRRAVVKLGPMTEMELACELDLTYLQVRAAAMGLIRRGAARWLRNKLTLLEVAQ